MRKVNNKTVLPNNTKNATMRPYAALHTTLSSILPRYITPSITPQITHAHTMHNICEPRATHSSTNSMSVSHAGETEASGNFQDSILYLEKLYAHSTGSDPVILDRKISTQTGMVIMHARYCQKSSAATTCSLFSWTDAIVCTFKAVGMAC